MAVRLKSGVDGHCKQFHNCLKQSYLLKKLSTAARTISHMTEITKKMAEGNNRKIYIMRHAERVDFTFGDWIPTSFDENGTYIRTDLNMPVSVPSRADGPHDFFKDCPLTNVGLYQATLTGLALKESGVKFSHVFCSPSLRCVETCTNVLAASNQSNLPLNIEPGLFEWLKWYMDGMPVWLSLDALKNCGFNVSLTYKPVVNSRDLTNTSETIPEYYARSHLLTKEILNKYPDGNLFFVGHAATLDGCTRQLVGRPEINFPRFREIITRTPYASVVTAVQERGETWRLQPPPFPSASVRQADNQKYDWRILDS